LRNGRQCLFGRFAGLSLGLPSRVGLGLASRLGVSLALSGSRVELLKNLFNEEIGAVVQVAKSKLTQVQMVLDRNGVDATAIGRVEQAPGLTVRSGEDVVLELDRAMMQREWSEMSYRILGAAWPRHFNKVIAETMYEHIKTVGLPTWSEEDQALAKAVQQIMDSDEDGLATELDSCPQRKMPVLASSSAQAPASCSWPGCRTSLRPCTRRPMWRGPPDRNSSGRSRCRC